MPPDRRKESQQMAVTMQQVAELAGVSRGTVDRVLHGRPNVDAVVREKVQRKSWDTAAKRPRPRRGTAPPS